ncbi:MAG: MBOAT family O-acyltransferase [Cyanobacteria bacterium J06598_1]
MPTTIIWEGAGGTLLFNSFAFVFFFFPIVLLGTYLTYKKSSVAYFWLVGASLFFYGWWNPANLPLILGSAVANYWMGRRLSHQPQKSLLTLGIAANLLALGYFKYTHFFVDTLNSLFSDAYVVKEIVLPLAISFFTFQQVAYLVDAYRGETQDYSFMQYLLFVTFFPQLIAGPIVHHREMTQQFERLGQKPFTWEDLATGLVIFTIGLMKKTLIADNLSPFVVQAFSTVESGALLSSIEAWRAALSYTFQLYFDFSGYADMAIGSALAIGIRLPINFDSPYKSHDVIEFWRRWHMTLSRFLKDYLYIPLGGKYNRSRNLLITMLLGGLWHGAGWTFIVWGGLHGAFLSINHAWKRCEIQLPVVLGWLITFIAVLHSWVVFRAESLAGALRLFSSMYSFNLTAQPTIAAASQNTFYLLLAAGLAFLMPNTAQLTHYCTLKSVRFSLPVQWQPTLFWNVLLSVGLLYSLTQLTNVSEFLYFQF